MEDRLLQSERDIADLRVSNAQLAASVEHLTATIEQLSVTVTNLNQSMTFSKGAAWGIVAMASAVSSAIAAVITYLTGR